MKTLKKKSKPQKTLVTTKQFRGQQFDPNIGFVDGVPIADNLMEMIDAYQLHPWVYSCVNVIATHFASVEYKIYIKGEQKIEDTNHPFTKILAQPNPYMTGFDLRESTAISREMCGNAYWALERDGSGVPVEAWPLPPHLVRAVASAESPIDHYIMEVDGKRIRFEYSDIIHFQYANPKSMLYGQGSALAARTEIVADMFAAIWNKNFFKNSGRPDAILETDEVLDQDVRTRLIKAWKMMHSGVSNAHRMAILEGGTKYKQAQSNQKDMDFFNQRKNAMQSIVSVFNVPPAMVGILEFANYANMDKQVALFWDIMTAKIRQIEEMLTMRAAQITFRPNSVVRANLENVRALRPDYLVLSQALRNLVESGIPINDCIRVMQLPFKPVEGGDIPRTVQNPEIQEEQETEEENEEKAVLNGKLKAVQTKAVVPENELRILQREMKWKAFDLDLRDREEKMIGGLRGYFKSQKRRVKAALEKNADKIIGKSFIAKAISVEVELLFDEGRERKIMEGVVAKPIKRAYFDYAAKKGKLVNPDFDFNLQDAVALAWVENKKTKIVREANAFTLEEISDAVVESIEEALKEGFSESETIDQIVDRIDEIYDFAVKGRAERIARTEIVSASNAGGWHGMKDAGAEKKEWLATSDDKTRESHRQLDGEVVSIGEKFVSPVTGEKLEFPGDPSAEPSEIVNCRCTVIPVVE